MLLARWSGHCRRAYIICLEKAYHSPYFTGGDIDGPANEETINALKTAFKGLDNTILNMRVRMSLRIECDALDKFRATMKNPEKFKRYLRVDSESLSMLLPRSRSQRAMAFP